MRRKAGLDIFLKHSEFSYENSLHTKKVQNSYYITFDDNCLNLSQFQDKKRAAFGPKVTLQK